MKYFIGIDGGGTKTKIVLTDKDLEIYDQDSSGPSNFLTEGKEKAGLVITELIWDIIRGSGIRSSDINSVCAGIAGTGRIEDRQLLREEIELLLKKKGVFINNFIIDTDARASLMGAHSGKPGCILIAGTGSMLYGETSKGNFFRCGGFGRIIGDEGGGYSIGRKALMLVAKAMDGRGAKNKLTNIISEELKITAEDDLIDGVYKSGINIPSTAELVIKAAEQNEPAAIEILESESDELVRHIAVASSKFDKEMPLSLSGGLLENENIYLAMIKEKIHQKFPNVIVKKVDYPPDIGAILLSGLKI